MDPSDDIREIEALIARQFASLEWDEGGSGDWQAFIADFLADTVLYPSARPARPQSVEAFVERMKGLVGTTLISFKERVLGTEIRVFGNVAVAIAACEMTENARDVNRNVEMLLLVKTDGAWKIVAQAWDKETPTHRIPEVLTQR